MSDKSMKVALVHDWLAGMCGGEKVLEVLCALFPAAQATSGEWNAGCMGVDQHWKVCHVSRHWVRQGEHTAPHYAGANDDVTR